jgi:hypothetical protein
MGSYTKMKDTYIYRSSINVQNFIFSQKLIMIISSSLIHIVVVNQNKTSEGNTSNMPLSLIVVTFFISSKLIDFI